MEGSVKVGLRMEYPTQSKQREPERVGNFSALQQLMPLLLNAY